MPTIEIQTKITLLGPFLTKSTKSGGFGIDAPVARDSQGRMYVPGAQVRGRLREAWDGLAHAGLLADSDIVAYLGPNRDDNNWRRRPALLRFSDFVHVPSATAAKMRLSQRIKIDPNRGSVEKGALQILESPFENNERCVFEGTIRFEVQANNAGVREIERRIEKALQWIDSFGALKTSGFGRVDRVACTSRVAHTAKAPELRGDRISFALRPRQPFCIAGHRPAGNIFESETAIPGAAIRGCIAAALNKAAGKPVSAEVIASTDPARPELCRHFPLLRVTHLLPSRRGGAVRPSPLPRSFVASSVNLTDFALRADLPMIDGKAARFSGDWKKKDWDHLPETFHTVPVPKELRVRTAIDTTNRRAEESMLFAYEMCVPDKKEKELDWLGTFDLSAIPSDDRAKVAEQLSGLLANGLDGLGKTKASASVVPLDHGPSVASSLDPIGPDRDLWVVTLVTPALLCDPRDLLDTAVPAADLQRSAYAATFAQTSGGDLELVRYFHDQRLAGGEFLYQAFQQGRPYWPWLLTLPGSVFVLRGRGPRAANQIKDWFDSGLPIPAKLRDLYGLPEDEREQWRGCPFVRQNGFGEIAVNLDTTELEAR
jgi:hypothetical protein